MQTNRVEQQLRQVSVLSDMQAADGALLEAFLLDRDEAAFTALVRRYGPMVLGICQRVLRNTSDADDAFQATFLVLVRRAAEVRCRATLGNWLYGVAYRTALHARTVNARRRRIEGQVRPMERDDSPEDAVMRPELQALLDQELNRLPAKYRESIVLCDLLGKTIREAARQLRCPEGTVCSRLARGRELLRQRLARRGTALTLAALTLYLAQNKAPAAAPLIDTTVKTAALVAAGNVAAAGGLAPNAAALMEGVLKSMLLTKLKILSGLLLVFALIGAASTLAACRSLAGPQPGTSNPPANSPPAEKELRADEDKKPSIDRERLRYGGKPFAHWQDVLRTDLKPEVRIEALKALGAFGVNGYGDEATATILEVMRNYDELHCDNDDLQVLQVAEATLARIGPKVLPTLAKMYDNGKRNERGFVVEVLRAMADQPEAALLLMHAVRDKEAGIRDRAVQYLGGVDPKTKGWVSTLVEALSDKDANIRRAAAVTLSGLNEPVKEVISGLAHSAVKDSSPPVRQQALLNLMQLRQEPGTLIPVLTTVMEQERDAHIRSAAYQFIQNLGPNDKDFVPALIDALKNPRNSVLVRREIVIALRRMAPAAKDAIPALLDILGNKETDAELRDAASKTLNAIRREPNR